MTYECLGGNNYRFTMVLYKDCLDPASPDFDRPGYFQVFNADNNSLYNTETVDPSNEGNVVPVLSGCIENLPAFCTKVATYTFTINLPNNNNGYIIAYERCCRNGGVINLDNSGSTGTAIFVKLTKQAMQLCNKAPVFQMDPPNFVCINSTLDIDFSATDPDGDRLVYSLCAPYTAGDQNNPTPPTSGPINYPPFDVVAYYPGYSFIQPLGAGSLISIDSLTGKISGIPKTQGLFTIAVCVKEYRGATLLSETIRDFQINVQNCAVKEAHPTPPDDPKKASVKINDSTFVVCNGKSVQFTNPGSTNVTYYWNFGDPTTLADTSLLGTPTYTYPDTGLYKVKLVIDRGKACTDSGYVYVKVYDPLQLKPTFTPVCTGTAMQFRDSSISAYNDVNSWKWKFTIVDSALTKNAAFAFAAAGNYNVSLFVGTTKGCLVQKDTVVTVYAKPNANFTSNNLCYRHNTAFTDASTVSSGTITRYYWNFGDGGTDTLKNTSHTYTTFDSFPVQHIVTSNFGCRDTIMKKIKMDDTVRISYTTAPASLCEKAPITFSNTSTGGNASGYQWIINNGAPVANQTNTTVTFNSAGTYPVKLISTNRCGNDTLNSSIKISTDPSVNLGPDVLVCHNAPRTITAAGSYDSLRWSTNQTTSSIQIDGKTSPIVVTVYNGGCFAKDTINAQQQVITPSFSNAYLCFNKPVLFNNTSTVNNGSIASYDWHYGDGNTDVNVTNPTHTYTAFNNYTVQLIATSTIGCKDTAQKTLSMDSVLKVDFTTAELISCEKKQVQFVDLTTGGVNNQDTWRINSTNSNTKNATYTFSGPGIYPVRLVVSNRCYTDSLTKNIQVRPRPVVNLGKDTILCKYQSVLFNVNKSAYDSIRWIDGTNAATDIADGSINPFKIKVYLDGCDAEDTVNVTPQQFTLGFSNTFICYNKSVTFNNTSSVTPGTISNYQWDLGDGATATVKNPSHTYSVFGPKNIRLIAQSANGCKDTLNRNISMDDSVRLQIDPLPSDVCIYSTVQYANLSSGGVNTAYTWTLNQANPKTDSIVSYTFTTSGQQVLQLLALSRCGRDSIYYTFNTKPLPPVSLQDSIIMCPGELRTLEATGDFDSLYWSTGASVNPTEIDGTTSPVLFTAYKNGCKSTDSVLVIANCDVYIPDAFTPNSDGMNDLFNVMPVNILTYKLQIYDRWGKLLFETTDPSKSWDGTYKGQPCQQDTYSYYASGVKKDNKPFTIKGTLVLLR